MKSVGPGEKSLSFISSNSATAKFSSERLNPTADDSKELGSVAFAIVTILGTGDDEPPAELSVFEQLDKAKRLKIKIKEIPFFFILIPFCEKYSSMM
jgi:hypothetical protein